MSRPPNPPIPIGREMRETHAGGLYTIVYLHCSVSSNWTIPVFTRLLLSGAQIQFGDGAQFCDSRPGVDNECDPQPMT